jgi:hypothetical protein
MKKKVIGPMYWKILMKAKPSWSAIARSFPSFE